MTNAQILIIEDNEEVRENLEEILSLSGYKVATAPDGKIGVQQAMETPPDLILCDVMMPELDGFGVLNILAKKPATASIPFVFLTAKTEKDDIRRGMNLGADDYITKPFYKDELLGVIETRLRKSQHLREASNRNEEPVQTLIDAARGLGTLRNLSEKQRLRRYERREIIFQEDDYPHYLYRVRSGQVLLYKTNEHGKEYVITKVEQGEFFGYTALLLRQEYPFAAQTSEPTELELLSDQDFYQLLHTDRDVAASFIKLLAGNVVDKEEQLLQLAYDSIRKRVANALVRYYDQHGSSFFTLHREDLARMIGTAKESVIRTLSEFKRDALIDIKQGQIRILKVDQLRSLPY